MIGIALCRRNTVISWTNPMRSSTPQTPPTRIGFAMPSGIITLMTRS
ncbi:hypothetical protein SBADM41S_03791 [Streptomyces badius]